MSQGGSLAAGGGGGGSSITSLSGNVGSATPVAGNVNIVTSNTTIRFSGSGSTLTQNFGVSNLGIGTSFPNLDSGYQNVTLGQNSGASITDGMINTIIGYGCGTSLNTGSTNCILGASAATGLTSGNNNIVIGAGSAQTLISGSDNTFIGSSVANGLTTGSGNLILGVSSGIYTSSESNNVILAAAGVIGDNNTIRVGRQGSGTFEQNRCFVAGITGTTVASSAPVAVNASGQLSSLGTGSAGQVLKSTGATSPTWQTESSYALSLTQSAAFSNPSSLTTYYVVYGSTWGTAISSASTGRIWIPKSGTITSANGNIAVQGSLGSAGPVTVRIRVNDTTNFNITTTLQINASSNVFSNAALSIPVVAGDYIHFQVVTPPWTPAPTNIVFACSLFITS